MIRKTKLWPITLALMAAILYAINTPFSKVLLEEVSPSSMAAFLYLGAGLGVGVMYLFNYKDEDKEERLGRKDLIYVIGMIVLDIAAPIFLMLGIKYGTASNASLLGNFEIVATSLIALFIFKEKISTRLWAAIGFITLSSIILSFESTTSLKFSLGSFFVILATSCWGLENNCTRNISDKSTYQIVVLKGIFSGLGAFAIARLVGEPIPPIKYIIAVLALGYVSYGLSIFVYVRAQRDLGAAKTSAYYAVAPFVGAFLAFLINGDRLTANYYLALFFMIVGTIFVVYDTMVKSHQHVHSHTIVHTHDGQTHTHKISHNHEHRHFLNENKHDHKHKAYLESEAHKEAHKQGRYSYKKAGETSR